METLTTSERVRARVRRLNWQGWERGRGSVNPKNKARTPVKLQEKGITDGQLLFFLFVPLFFSIHANFFVFVALITLFLFLHITAGGGTYSYIRA